MGGKRKAQLKTTSQAASSKLLKSKALRVPDLICPCCGKARGTSAQVALMQTEFQMQVHAPAWANLEAGWSVNAARHGWLSWACDSCLKAGRALEAKPWLQTYGYNSPKFAYVDEVKKCSDCGNEFVFAATEQAFWYETLEFLIYFDDQTTNSSDPVLDSLDPQRRKSLISTREDALDGTTYRFDIHVQGELETVFFDV
jgi:Probable zinc-ribbon domain